MVFLCLRHLRLLQHECPGCGTPVHSVRTANANAIARLSDDTLHPWQCRFPTRPTPQHQPETACATDLTRHDPPSAEPDTVTMTVLLQLQQRLVDLLTAGGPETAMSAGAPVPAAHYFADLRATVAMGMPAPCLATVLDTECTSRVAQAEPLLNIAGKKKTSKPCTAPPTDPLAAGAVLDIAVKLLQASDPHEARRHLTPLVHHLRDADRALSTYLRRPTWISKPLRNAVRDD